MRKSRFVRHGSARMAGVAMGALCLCLAFGLIAVVKGYLNAPATTEAGSANGSNGSPAAAQGGPTRPVAETIADAERAIGAKDYPKAAAIVSRALETTPMDQDLRLELAKALVAQKKFAEAYDQYEKAIVIGPKSAKLSFAAGTVAYQADLFDRAEEHYLMAQNQDMKDPQIPLYLAMAQVKLNKTQAAVGSLLRVIKMKPDSAEAWGTLGEIYFADDKPDLALQNIEKARELQPSQTRWRLVEAKILNRQNQPQQAATSLLAMDASERRKPLVMKVLAESYGMLGKPADAAALYADAAQNDANGDPAVSYEAALWYERAKDPANALKFAKAAAGLGYEDARSMVERLGGSAR